MAQPRIDAVSPSHVSAGATGQLLVSGDGFESGDRVWVGSIPSSGSIWVTGQLLSANIPPLSPGTYDLAIATVDGRRITKPAAVVVLGNSVVAVRPSVSPAPPVRRALPSAAPETPLATPTRSEVLNVTGHWHLVDTIESARTAVPPIVFDDITLTQTGAEVSGVGAGIVSLRGTLLGRTLSSRYVAYDKTQGQFTWTFSADATSFTGTFTSTAPNSGSSEGRLLQRGR